jgi:hypothetical protein
MRREQEGGKTGRPEDDFWGSKILESFVSFHLPVEFFRMGQGFSHVNMAVQTRLPLQVPQSGRTPPHPSGGVPQLAPI